LSNVAVVFCVLCSASKCELESSVLDPSSKGHFLAPFEPETVGVKDSTRPFIDIVEQIRQLEYARMAPPCNALLTRLRYS
jgi:hypothetical protein